MSNHPSHSTYVPPGIPINTTSGFGSLSGTSSRDLSSNSVPQTSPTPISLSPTNPCLLVTDWNLVVPSVTYKHSDLISYSKSDKICFVDGTNLRVWNSGSVSTLITSSGPIVDVTISPHFDTFVAIVDAHGHSTVQDLTQKQPTFKLIPNSNVAGGLRPFLKASWHPSKASTFVTAYQDGLVCIWDLATATASPKAVVNGVATFERPDPINNGPVFADLPQLLVAVRVPEMITDIAVSGDYLLTTSISGTVRIYGLAKGDLLSELQDHAPSDLAHGPTGGHGNIVVISEAPFIFVTGNRLNNYLRIWKIVSTAPLKFALVDHLIFNSLPLPPEHPGQLAPFGMLRQSSMNTIVMFHPALCALWLITIGNSGAERTLTFGSKQPFSCLSTPEAAKGFVGISEKMAVIIKFSNVPTENVSIVPENLDSLEICQNSARVGEPPAASQVAIHGDASHSGSQHHGGAQEPSVPMETLKLILQKQNRIYLEHLKQQRAVTVAKQAHYLKILQELPNTIMGALSPILTDLSSKNASNVDVNHLSTQIANSVSEPAGQAMSMYFSDALLPGYKRACGFIANDVSSALDAAVAGYSQQLAPQHASKTIDPLIHGLVQASANMTKTLGECQRMQSQAFAQLYPSEASFQQGSLQNGELSVASGSGLSNASAMTQITASATSSSSAASIVAPSPSKKVVKSAKETPTQTSTILANTSASSTSASSSSSTTSGKKRERTPSIPPTTSVQAASNKSKEVKKPATPAAIVVAQPKSSVESETSVQVQPQVQVQAQESLPTIEASSSTFVSPQQPQIPAAVAAPVQQREPRPEPVALPTVPLPDSVRTSIMSCINQKKIQEAVKVALDSSNVEAIGFLSSRADISQSIDFIDQDSLASMLHLITAQTAPTTPQLQRYSKIVHMILSNLKIKELTNVAELLTSFTTTKNWLYGAPTETEDLQLIDQYLAELFP